MKTIIMNILPALLLAAALSGCGKDGFDCPDYYTRIASTEWGQKVVDGSSDCISHVKTDKVTQLTEGVTLLDMGYLNASSHAMQIYVYKVELAPSMVKVSVPDDGTKVEKTQKMTAQATAIENKGTYLVMGGISGGRFDSATGAPQGMLYHNSKAISPDPGKDAAFFAIMKDGSAVCMETDRFADRKERIAEGVSGASMLLKNGYVLAETDAATVARTAVGVDQMGGTVYLAVVDKGTFFYSNGISCGDLADILKGCGAYNAMTLDSGNNVTAFVRNEDSDDLFEVVNRPGNMGLEEAVGNGLVILQY